jgi:hypothetical protein
METPASTGSKRTWRKLTDVVGKLAGVVTSLAEGQQRLVEGQQRLQTAQIETTGKLDALIHIVDEWIRNRAAARRVAPVDAGLRRLLSAGL